LQYYTSSIKNSFIADGYLIIEARSENYGSNKYTSARIISKDKRTFTYGRIDIRAKLPKGKGIWPALWMLGNNISQLNWPACGEIDIMELLGHESNKVYGTMHWGAAGGPSTHIGSSYSLNSGDYSSGFHVFSLLWEVDKLTFLVDDIIYFTGTKAEVTGDYPFDKPFFFIMNIAVGGNWPGNPDASTTFPQRMVVDYVRVFQ
jgi:beta-glucanase (GH16 family)